MDVLSHIFLDDDVYIYIYIIIYTYRHIYIYIYIYFHIFDIYVMSQEVFSSAWLTREALQLASQLPGSAQANLMRLFWRRTPKR